MLHPNSNQQTTAHAGQTTPVYCFTGYSGTGKTTFLEQLVAELKTREYRVGMLKMDAHNFEIDKEGKDSYRFGAAGADVVGIASATKAAFMEQRSLDFPALLSRFTGVDLLLVEGYTLQGYPTLTLFREASGNGLASDPETCLAVLADAPLPVATHCPILDLNNIAAAADFILAHYAANRGNPCV